jgi:ligand-binding sensor domain-containing protein/serine phosphatase RsbU (regulator of sigma subunit)
VNKYIFLIFIFLEIGLIKSYGQTSTAKLSPAKKLTQYILNQWDTDNGLPSSNVRRIVQTQDGYLWLAGFDGLTSFDGVRFVNYNKANIPGFSTNLVQVLQEAPDGTLWIGTHGSGLFSYKNARFEKVGLDSIFIACMFFENKEKYLVSGRGAGLYELNPQTKAIKQLDIPALNGISVYKMEKDKKNQLWFATEKGLICRNGTKYKTYTTADGLPSNTILELFFDYQQKLWVGTTEGLAYMQEGKFYEVKDFEKNIVHKILQDKSKSLWIATSTGLYRQNHYKNILEKFPYSKENPLTNVLDLHLDAEGSLWIATYRNGLFRIKDGKFTNFTYQDGLSAASVGSVCEYKPGEYMLGMNDGAINLIKGNDIKEFNFKTDIPKVRIFNILKDSKKNTWISTFNGVIKISPTGEEKLYNKQNGLSDNAARIAYEDEQGNIWIGTRIGGITKISPEGKFEVLDQSNGLSSNFIMSIQGDKKGNVWVGTNDAGISVISPEGKIKNYSTKEGLVSDLVFNTYTDAQNVTWIVTNGGISRFEEGKFFNYTSQDGLLNDSPFDFLEDEKQQVWLTTSRGIIKVNKKELNDYAKGQIKTIHWEIFDKHDGMKSEDCTGAAHSLIDSKGKIWIPTNGGVVVIDPERMPKNHLPPALRINFLVVDNQNIDIHEKITLEAGVRRLVFDYSALSLLASSKVKFKYKLIGFDPDWVDAQKERQAVYTNLPPGNYTFQVIAANNDGVWNMKGTKLSFQLKPFFYQTSLFYVFLGLLVIALVYGIIRWRVYYLQQKRIELEHIVEVKTREIYDQNQVLAHQTEELGKQTNLLERKNNSILQSIAYAKRIQDAMLPPLDEIKTAFPDSFVMFKPRDIVSGDFYWLAIIEAEPLYENITKDGKTESVLKGMTSPKTLIAAVDCTGHGVPGAFMSMIGNDLLNEIVGSKKITEVDKILTELHRSISQTLKQQNNANQDGMDLTLCIIDHEAGYLDFAGAKNSLMYIRDGELNIIKGDKLPIGGWMKKDETVRHFEKHQIKLDGKTQFYMFSDGYQDQFSEEYRKKFARHRIREMLMDIHTLPMEKQGQLIEQKLDEWQGNEPQTDDILVIGFQI